MNVILKLSAESDLVLIERYVRAYHAFDGVTLPERNIAAAVRPLLGVNNLGRIWLICLASQPIGYAVICFGYSIEFAGRDAFVDELYIIDEKRGKGIGRVVLGLLKSEAALLGVNALHLEVARNNARARQLYQTAGFQPRERFTLMSARMTNSWHESDNQVVDSA